MTKFQDKPPTRWQRFVNVDKHTAERNIGVVGLFALFAVVAAAAIWGGPQ